MLNTKNSGSLLLSVLALQFIFCISVIWDIPIARQAIGFLYLTIVPGIVFLRLLKLEKLDPVETILFSTGFSIAFSMFAGLLINEIAPIMGISKPLSETPLMILLTGLVLLFCFLNLQVRKKIHLNIIGNLTSIVHTPSTLLFLCLPILSVIGVTWVNVYENNLILLFMIIVISFLFAMGVLSKKFLPPKFYSIAVLVIAISLLLHFTLISNYVVGTDIQEYFLFKTTKNNAEWNPVTSYGDPGYDRFNGMLSLTILPTIYSTLLNMDATWVCKILYPLIFSFVPLGLYRFWQTYVGKKNAFVSAFLFMAFQPFYTEIVGQKRQIIAELFFTLLLLLMFNKKMKPFDKIVCFVIFSAGLVVSHYAISYIFLFLISLTWICTVITRQRSRRARISATMVALFFVMTFSWYIFTSSSAAFDSTLTYGNNIYSELNRFFDPASRGITTLRGLGLEPPPSMWNSVSRVFAYSTQFLIVIGFIGLITGRVKRFCDREQLIFTSLAMSLLAFCLGVPYFARSLNMTRFYHILLFFLAPLFMLGAEVLVKSVTSRKTEASIWILLLAVLIPYFLFQTGFMYEVTGSESWSMPLSMHRMSRLRLYECGYLDQQSVFGAQWVSKNVDVERTQIYADIFSQYRILSTYGMMYRGYVNQLSNTTQVKAGGTIYLNLLNVVEGRIAATSCVHPQMWDSNELSFNLCDLNRIYSNGGCEIYRNATSTTNP